MLPVLFRRQLRLIITVDGITDIPTEGITTDITITGTTIGTEPGLSASMGGVQGIIAIGKRILCAPRSPLVEIAVVLVSYNHIARFIVNSDDSAMRAVEKLCIVNRVTDCILFAVP